MRAMCFASYRAINIALDRPVFECKSRKNCNVNSQVSYPYITLSYSRVVSFRLGEFVDQISPRGQNTVLPPRYTGKDKFQLNCSYLKIPATKWLGFHGAEAWWFAQARGRNARRTDNRGKEGKREEAANGCKR